MTVEESAVSSISLVGLTKEILNAKDSASKISSAQQLAKVIKENDLHHFFGLDEEVLPLLLSSISSKQASCRQGVAIVFKVFAESFGIDVEPYLISNLDKIMDLIGDKQAEVRNSANDALSAMVGIIDKFSAGVVVPILLPVISDPSKKWQSKIGALNMIEGFTKKCSALVCDLAPDIIPVISASIWDTKPEIRELSKSVLISVMKTIDNPDIIPFIGHLMEAIVDPTTVGECIYKLAATTFVTEVKAPTLAVMTPLLARGLKERKTAVLRQTSIIIENMCKLVEDPTSAHQFLPQLKPGMNAIVQGASDPELRDVATRAMNVLLRVCGGDDESGIPDPKEVEKEAERDANEILELLKDGINKIPGAVLPNKILLKYTQMQISSLCRVGHFDLADWNSTILHKLNPFTKDSEKSRVISECLVQHCSKKYNLKHRSSSQEEEEEGIEICNCEFSVAYGGMILLNNTKLRLISGKCYALTGPNGVGKSTLMRSIYTEQLEGFPKRDVLKTVYVEHDLQSDVSDIPVLEFILSSNSSFPERKDEIVKILHGFGLTDEYLKLPVGSLSGGWKMKLELSRAIIENADMLLLDEPTNHLDVKNVDWLVDYIKSLKRQTLLIVSHDSSFIDRVCTHVIHFENRKLKVYPGNLSKFALTHPEVRSYYDLKATSIKFTLPEPGFLEGIKSKDKAIIKMLGVSYTYPGSSKPALSDVSVQCSLNSRVGVVGPNGAGKSTLVKLLTGELVCSSGEVWKHPNLRVAYVAQHAFHHVEMHLDKTPNEYVRWRYSNGEDKESLAKASRQLTPEEEEIIKKPLSVEGEKRYVEEIIGRRKVKRSYEYEIKWKNLSYESNTWHSRERLEDWGFAKMVQWYDERETAREGVYSRTLTSAAVQKHFEDVGLDVEFSTHSRIRGLSGGQKVKVVLGSAMWNNPHILVLDEPTNYLDRDSLGALAGALETFSGGVIIITHNRDFVSTVCSEIWNVSAGVIDIEGGKKPTVQEKIVMKEEETVTDAFGNVTKVKSTRKLTRKEQKQKEKRRQMKIKNGEPLSSSDEDF